MESVTECSARACKPPSTGTFLQQHAARRALCREGDAPWEAVQSRSLESILGYGFIIESSQQQYELKAIHVLFPPPLAAIPVLPLCLCSRSSLWGHAVFLV